MDRYSSIAHRIHPGATLLRRWPLRGGVSAHVEALELRLPGGELGRVVLRRLGAGGFKSLDPGATSSEYRLLGVLAAAGMPVPQPLLLHDSGDLLGAPFFVMAFVDGTSELDAAALPDALRQMAEFLLGLHSLRLALPDLPAGEDPVAGALHYLPAEDALRAALEQCARRPNAPVLVHGDFWPGNILWRDGRIAAVLDWEDAACADPLSDLAGCRLELRWKYGTRAAEDFTRHYLAGAAVDRTELPLWELYAASAATATMAQWGLDPAREAEMRRSAQAVIASTRREILGRA